MHRYQLTLWDLFKLQFLIAPLFLAAAYADYDTIRQHLHPLTALTWLLAPPFLYVYLLVTLSVRGRRPSSYVFAGMRNGVLFGALFCVLSWGLSGAPAIIRALIEFQNLLSLASRRGLPISFGMIIEAANETLATIGLVTGFIVLHYVALGAASGVFAAITVQFMPRMQKRIPGDEKWDTSKYG